MTGQGQPSAAVDEHAGAIVKTCGRRSFRRLRVGVFVGSFDELAGLERGAGADEREECFSKDPLHASGLDRFEFTILGSGGAGQPGPVTHYT